MVTIVGGHCPTHESLPLADTSSVPLVSLLAEINAPRRPQARCRALEAILLMAPLAVICDTHSRTEVELFGHRRPS